MDPSSRRQALHLKPLPRPKTPLEERRHTRSDSASEALKLALGRAAERGALDAVIIADEFGMLVANSPTGFDLAMLAAVTPIVGRGRAIAKVRRKGQPRDLTVRPVNVGDEVFYVAALGGHYAPRLREVASSIAATRRILAA